MDGRHLFSKMNRREFISTGAALGAFTIIPNHVYAAKKHGMVAPSDRITMVHIACGTESLNEIGEILASPGIEIVGVADPNRESYDYIHWGPNGLRNHIRKLIGEPLWKEGKKGVPGGRDVMKEVVEIYYRKNRPGYRGTVAAVEDYKELLDKMPDVDAVKILTPDHLHAYQALDCMRRGKHIIMHKPLGNKMTEAMDVVDMAKASKLSTYLLPYHAFAQGNLDRIKNWIDAGAIGKLKEVHSWTNRPVWPQYAKLPVDKPQIPEGFNWDLWLGPAQMRDYNPMYTHATFRGWYEFGAGAIADMGYYGLWPVFDAFKLDSATSVSTSFSRVVETVEREGCLVPSTIANDYSFPMAAAYRFEVPYKDKSGKIILQWHDGGMKPQVPEDYPGDSLPVQGMMFVGTEGTIMSGFHRENPVILGERASLYEHIKGNPAPSQEELLPDGTMVWVRDFINGCHGIGKSPASFEFAKEVNETFNLGVVSLMRNGRKMVYDPETRTITNDPEGNKLLTRDVRKGWEMK